MAAHPTDEFRDSTSLTTWTLRLLYLHLGISVIAVWSGILEIQVLKAMAAGAFETDEALQAAADASDGRQRIAGIAQLAIFIASGVFSLVWIHRACHNARVRATAMEFTPGWAVGWYFVPIGNLWKPYQAMKEIWETTAVQADKPLADGGSLLGAWWTFWIVNNLVANAAFRLTLRAKDMEQYQFASKLTMVSDLLEIPLTILLIQIVRKLSAMQDDVRASPPPPAVAAPGANW